MSYPFFVPSVINTNPITTVPFGTFVSSPYTSEISISVTKEDLPTKTERVTVTTLPINNYYYPTNLYYGADPYTYSYPMYTNISYLDVNSDKELHKKACKLFFSELYNKYIPETYPRLLNYVKLSNKDIELVKSVGEAKNISTKSDEYGEKINYLAEYIFTKKDVYNILWDYVERRNVKWWDLKYYADDVENLLVKSLEEKIKDMILD